MINKDPAFEKIKFERIPGTPSLTLAKLIEQDLAVHALQPAPALVELTATGTCFACGVTFHVRWEAPKRAAEAYCPACGVRAFKEIDT